MDGAGIDNFTNESEVIETVTSEELLNKETSEEMVLENSLAPRSFYNFGFSSCCSIKK